MLNLYLMSFVPLILSRGQRWLSGHTEWLSLKNFLLFPTLSLFIFQVLTFSFRLSFRYRVGELEKRRKNTHIEVGKILILIYFAIIHWVASCTWFWLWFPFMQLNLHFLFKLVVSSNGLFLIYGWVLHIYGGLNHLTWSKDYVIFQLLAWFSFSSPFKWF